MSFNTIIQNQLTDLKWFRLESNLSLRGKSPASHRGEECWIPDHSMWRFLWTKWYRDWFFSLCFGFFPVSIIPLTYHYSFFSRLTLMIYSVIHEKGSIFLEVIVSTTVKKKSKSCMNLCLFLNGYRYRALWIFFYRCTVHLEDSLIITHQRMH